MNKAKELDLKPHIYSICESFNTTKDEIISRRFISQPDIVKQILFYLLYFKVGSTYQNIANEFNLTPQAVYFSVRKASERIDEGRDEYLKQLDKLYK
jgi:hypothetical protein